jgi:hypothetical protein
MKAFNFLSQNGFLIKTFKTNRYDWYKTFHSCREKVLRKIVAFLNPLYRAFMPRNGAWQLTKEQLNQFPNGT